MIFQKLTLGLVALLCSTGVSHAASDAEVMKPINNFLSALSRRDKAGMLAETAPHIEIMSARKGALRRLSIDAITDLIVGYKGGAAAELIHDPIIHVDDDLAVVWTPETWTIDGGPDHCASEVWTLLRLSVRWTIVGLADTAREDCK